MKYFKTAALSGALLAYSAMADPCDIDPDCPHSGQNTINDGLLPPPNPEPPLPPDPCDDDPSCKHLSEDDDELYSGESNDNYGPPLLPDPCDDDPDCTHHSSTSET